MNEKEFISSLPEGCQSISIEKGHKVALQHFTIGSDMWVVLLTRMPGDCSKAWKLSRSEYWQLEPKHGTRDRYIRENQEPIMQSDENPKRVKQGLLF